MALQNEPLAPGKAMAWRDITRAPALLQELFYHPERNPVTTGYLLPGRLLLVIRSHDSFAQIQRKSSHDQDHTPIIKNGYSFI